MQILPTSAKTSYDNQIAANALAVPQQADQSDFFRMLSKHLDTTPAQITPVLDANPYAYKELPEKSATPEPDYMTTAAPYSTSVEQTPTSDVRLTDKEVLQVAESLRKQGADEETVQRVEQLTGNPMGVTVETLVKAVVQEPAAKLTEGDMTRIASLTGKLDPTGKLSESVLDDLKNGRVMQAWTAISQALSQADPKTVFNIDKNEIVSLGKALRLSNGTLNALEKTFGGQESLNVSPQGLQRLLVPAQQEIITKAGAQSKIIQQLETALTPVVKQAKQRITDEETATSRDSRRVQQSQTLIMDSVTKNGFTRQTAPNQAEQAAQNTQKGQNNTAKNPNGSESGVGATQQANISQVQGVAQQATNANQQHLAATTQTQQTANAQATNQTQVNGQQTAQGNVSPASVLNPNGINGQFAQQQSNGQQDKQQTSGDDKNKTSLFNTTASVGKTGDAKASGSAQSANPWDALLQKLGVQSTANQSGAQIAQTASQIAQAKAGNMPFTSSRVLSQVEQGMLTALRDGSKSLQLQLHPAELGAMTVMLTTRNGEVSAMLRPERGETAVLLSQQMEQLKTSLEQQGLKVDKVEVQTQLKDNQNNTTWQGMDQHNASQEQKARDEELERIRRLTRMGKIGDSSITLARNIQNQSNASSTMNDGLHLVA